MTANRDVWADAAAYERYVGRWSRPVAAEFVSWLEVPSGAAWLDVGCGTGALTETILAKGSPARVVGVDLSPAYVERARTAITDARARFEAADAREIPEPDGTFDAAVSGLALNFVPHPDLAVAEMARAARPGGVLGAYVWDYAGEMQLMRFFWDAAVALDPAAADLDEGRRFPLCRPERLEALFLDAGFEHVAVRAIDVLTPFRDFDDYWAPFLGGQGPAPGYAAGLDEERRRRLRDRIRGMLPARPDGSIELMARAWAVRGARRRE